MALRTHEYVECQEGKWRPLVLSEVGSLFCVVDYWKCPLILSLCSSRDRIVIAGLDHVLQLTRGTLEGLQLL